jgi:oxygen-independent coproporphyrinogen III oxidase
MTGLYIHIPFCVKKCPYCDFSSFDDIAYLADDYIECVLKELKYYKNNFDIEFNTLFIGGGTPAILTEKQLDSLFTGIYSMIERKKLKEITIEVNPETVTDKKAKIFEANANRVSMGCQSFHDKFLEKLSRIHNAGAIYKAYVILRKNNIKNINFDLMYGIEGQSTVDVLHNIGEIVKLKPEHVSFYMLTIYNHTEFGRLFGAGELVLPHDDVIEHMYERGAQALEDAGYKQYEISNFAMPGKQCIHNLNYWKPGEYAGLGSSAASYFMETRYTNESSPAVYIKKIKEGLDPADFSEKIDAEKKRKDYIMMRLRTKAGLNYAEFMEIFKFDFMAKYSNIIGKMKAEGLAEDENTALSLTRKGFLISNEIIERFF